MNRGLLIDTCALIWIAALAEDDQVFDVETALQEARDHGLPLCVSPITAWEVGMLASKGRLPMSVSPKVWLDQSMTFANLTWADMSPAVLLASSFLPENPNPDPADRIIIATAREYGLRIVTRDRRILDYADKGHVMALAC